METKQTLTGKTKELYDYIYECYSIEGDKWSCTMPERNDLVAEFLVQRKGFIGICGKLVQQSESYGRCYRKLVELGLIPKKDKKESEQEYKEWSQERLEKAIQTTIA